LYGVKVEGINAVPGKISKAISCNNSEWSYHVYLPKHFHIGKEWPVWFVMSPSGGKSGKALQRYIPGAELTGSILVIPVESKNHFYQSQDVVKKVAQDVYKRLPVKRGFAFASGMSGGSRMSFLLSEMDKNVVGVLACGSGDGVYLDDKTFRQANLRPDTIVYSLVGTNCFNRTGAFESHQNWATDYRLRYFIGNHDWANSKLVTEGMAHLMGQVIKSKGHLLAYEYEHLKSLKILTEKLKSSEPWEASHLCKVGLALDDRFDNGYFVKTDAVLKKLPNVLKAQQAEADIMALAKKFYLKYDYFNGDTKPLPARQKYADTLEKKYTDLPHANLLKKLGAPSAGPK